MLYSYLIEIDDFCHSLQKVRDQIKSVYLIGDLAMHRVAPGAKAEFLVIVEELKKELVDFLQRQVAEPQQVRILCSGQLMATSRFDYLKLKKAKLLLGDELNLTLLDEPTEVECDILQARLEQKLARLQAGQSNELVIRLTGESLEILFYLRFGFLLSKFREYFYNAFYQIKEPTKMYKLKALFAKMLNGSEQYTSSEVTEIVAYLRELQEEEMRRR